MLLKTSGGVDDDIKFLCCYLDQSVRFEESAVSDELVLEHNGETYTGLDAVLECCCRMAGENFTPKIGQELKRARTSPSPLKGDISMVLLMNYINLVREMLEKGTLKNKEYIDQVTQRLSVKFDPDFYLLELKTGIIRGIEPVEDMDKIFCEKVESDREYTICSGLREYYKREELDGQTFLFVLNIKKAKFRNMESEGMICCVKEGDRVEALKVDQPRNSRLELEGFLSLFKCAAFEKVDLKKSKYKSALDCFKIIDHHLTFKGVKVLCNGECIRTEAANGPVS